MGILAPHMMHVMLMPGLILLAGWPVEFAGASSRNLPARICAVPSVRCAINHLGRILVIWCLCMCQDWAIVVEPSPLLLALPRSLKSNSTMRLKLKQNTETKQTHNCSGIPYAYKASFKTTKPNFTLDSVQVIWLTNPMSACSASQLYGWSACQLYGWSACQPYWGSASQPYWGSASQPDDGLTLTLSKMPCPHDWTLDLQTLT